MNLQQNAQAVESQSNPNASASVSSFIAANSSSGQVKTVNLQPNAQAVESQSNPNASASVSSFTAARATAKPERGQTITVSSDQVKTVKLQPNAQAGTSQNERRRRKQPDQHSKLVVTSALFKTDQTTSNFGMRYRDKCTMTMMQRLSQQSHRCQHRTQVASRALHVQQSSTHCGWKISARVATSFSRKEGSRLMKMASPDAHSTDMSTRRKLIASTPVSSSKGQHSCKVVSTSRKQTSNSRMNARTLERKMTDSRMKTAIPRRCVLMRASDEARAHSV